MTFPSEEQWGRVAALIGDNLRDHDRVMAPLEFGERLPDVVPYRLSRRSCATDYQWVVLHKDQLARVDRRFLEDARRQLRCVLANEVFVVYASRDGLPSVEEDDPHLQSLTGLLGWLDAGEHASGRVDPATALFDHPRELRWITRAELEAASRASAQSTYLGGGTLLCRGLARYLFYVDTQDVGLAPHLALNGCWEAWVTLAVAREVQDGHRCLDVGANVGYYAVLMADGAGPGGRVRACEPNPRLAGLLGASVEVNGLDRRVEVIDRAVTDRAGDEVRLHHPPGHPINASLFRQDGDEIAAETVTVDELVADWPRVDVVKVDVEGAEEAVWRGMLRTLVANPQITVFMEFSSGRQYDGRAFLERIAAAGFPLRYVDTDAEIRELPRDRCLEEGTDWVLYLRRT